MMELSQLFAVVHQVRATSGRYKKVGLLADFLAGSRGKDTELTALFLCGALRQGKIDLGWRSSCGADVTHQ